MPSFVRAEATLGERFVRCRSMESQYKHGGCVEETCNTSFCLDCLLHRESRLELHCRSAGRGGAAVAGPVRPMLTFPDKFHHAPPVPVHLPPSPHRTIHRDSAKLRLVEILSLLVIKLQVPNTSACKQKTVQIIAKSVEIFRIPEVGAWRDGETLC